MVFIKSVVIPRPQMPSMVYALALSLGQRIHSESQTGETCHMQQARYETGRPGSDWLPLSRSDNYV